MALIYLAEKVSFHPEKLIVFSTILYARTSLLIPVDFRVMLLTYPKGLRPPATLPDRL